MAAKNVSAVISADQQVAIAEALQSLVDVWGGDGNSIATMSMTNPDGTTCESVKQYAAVNMCSEVKAAFHAYTNPPGDESSRALYMDAVEYIKALEPDHDSHSDDVAVVLMFDRASSEQLAIGDGNDWSSMHLTLAYLGRVEDHPGKTRSTVIRECMKLAGKYQRFTAKANGLARFSCPDPDAPGARDAMVVNVDSPIINSIHNDLVSVLSKRGIAWSSDHGFTPHATLGYLLPDEPMPLDRWHPLDVRVSAISVWWGSEQITSELGYPYTPQMEDPDPVTAVIAFPTEGDSTPVAPGEETTAEPLRPTQFKGKGSKATNRCGALINKARGMFTETSKGGE